MQLVKQRLVAWQEDTDRKKKRQKHKNKSKRHQSPFYFYFFPKEVAFIPQLKISTVADCTLYCLTWMTHEHTHKKGENPVVTPGPDSYGEKTKVWQKQWFMSYGAVKRKCFCVGWREKAYSRKEQISKKEKKRKKRNVTDKTLNGFNNQNSCTIYKLHFKNIFIHIFFFLF